MRFIAPAREAIDPSVFARAPLSHWSEYAEFLCGPDWPDVDAFNRRAQNAANGKMPRFAAQTRDLLDDGLHYEQRIFERGAIATRERNWHDLLNALVWLRYPAIKTALNARQVAEIAAMGPKRRSRAQCALTHFDEAGAIVCVRDPALLVLWDAHDWHGLFWRERAAWSDGRIAAHVFGHAVLEHALRPRQLLVGKALAVLPCGKGEDAAFAAISTAIAAARVLRDPQELRPLPLSGIPGWHAANADESFVSRAPCFRPLRPGRFYPPPLVLDS